MKSSAGRLALTPHVTSGGVTTWTDSFTRADSTTTMGSTETGGATWTPLLGTWGINGNKAYQQSSTSDASVAIDVGSTNHTVQAVLSTIDPVGTGFVLRAVDATNSVLIAIQSGAITPYKRISGTFTGLTYTGTATFAAGDTLKVSLSGTTGTVFRNGTQVGTFVENSGLTGTKVGFRCNGFGPRFDDFLASVP